MLLLTKDFTNVTKNLFILIIKKNLSETIKKKKIQSVYAPAISVKAQDFLKPFEPN